MFVVTAGLRGPEVRACGKIALDVLTQLVSGQLG